MTRAWEATCPRARVYLLVRAAGPAGIHRSKVLAGFADYPEKMIDNLIYTLKLGRQIDYEPRTMKRGVYRVTSDCKVPVLRYDNLLTTLLPMLADCDAGVSDQVLADDAMTEVYMVRRTLLDAVLSGRVEAFAMPAAHGGGMGYRMAPAAAGAPA